jgi:hypothetical protein
MFTAMELLPTPPLPLMDEELVADAGQVEE